ncbi:MAG TPA: hypothetical protein VF832_10755 [Longimicrobiales bacterium]
MRPQSLLAPVIVAALLTSSHSASAQGGPPLITDDPFTPRAWHWEINTAFTRERGVAASATELPALDLNYGWGPRVQLKLEGPFRWVRSELGNHHGAGNLLGGVKYRFADAYHGWAISTYPQLQIPLSGRSASRLEGDSVWAFFLPVEAAHSHKSLEFATEIGYWFGPRPVREAAFGAVVGWTATTKDELVSECWAHGDAPFHPAAVICGVGFRRDIEEHVGLMASYEPVIGGSDPSRPDYLIYFGLQTHIRGGGFWRGARRALIGK